MHVRYSSKLTRITVLAGFFWLGILLVMTMGDYVSRDWIKLPGLDLRPARLPSAALNCLKRASGCALYSRLFQGSLRERPSPFGGARLQSCRKKELSGWGFSP